MKRNILALLFITSCVSSSLPSPDRFRKDDLYCWIKTSQGEWVARGIPESCPEGTSTLDVE